MNFLLTLIFTISIILAPCANISISEHVEQYHQDHSHVEHDHEHFELERAIASEHDDHNSHDHMHETVEFGQGIAVSRTEVKEASAFILLYLICSDFLYKSNLKKNNLRPSSFDYQISYSPPDRFRNLPLII